MEFLKPKNKKGSGVSTQQYVDAEEIRDGIIVLKSGALRSVVLVSSLNFDLKSSEEQEALISQYQGFLNSLDFPIQIVVSSRKFNIAPYLERLKNVEAEQQNELLRFQISEYKSFIKNMTEVANIMSKFFYVIVPFSPVEDKKSGLMGTLSGMFHPKKTIGLKGEQFETYKSQLLQRVEHVTAALSNTGVHISRLNTEEIIELLYNSYNPSLFTTTVVKNTEAIELA